MLAGVEWLGSRKVRWRAYQAAVPTHSYPTTSHDAHHWTGATRRLSSQRRQDTDERAVVKSRLMLVGRVSGDACRVA